MHKIRSVQSKVAERITAKEPGWVFTATDFLDLGLRTAVSTALSRMASDNQIQRLSRGLYYFPKSNPTIGILSPDSDAIADAVARKTGDTVFPTGADAANLLGLSTQVPAKIEYFTTGRSRILNVSGSTITLKHVPLAAIQSFPRSVILVIHALLYLGERGIDDSVVFKLKNVLSKTDMQQLALSASKLPSWIARTIELITVQNKKETLG